MDLGSILQAALSPNPDERKGAEQRLEEMQYAPQHPVSLFQIIVDTNRDMAVRQVAAINFKNFIAKNWSPDHQTEISIAPADKLLLRNHILLFLPQLPPLLRYTLLTILYHLLLFASFYSATGCSSVSASKQLSILIIRSTFLIFSTGSSRTYRINSNSTPLCLCCGFFQENTSESLYLCVSLLLLSLTITNNKTLCRFKSDEERAPVYGVVQQTFPLLLTIFNALVQIANPSIEVADLIKLICKIFWSSIYVRFFSLPLSSIDGR